MCFSAIASFTAGTVLIAFGGFTARRARRPAELPFALIPALFGAQQLIEGALWMTFSGQEAHLNAILTHLYSLFSHVLWPLYIPIAILLLEPVLWRRWLISGVAMAGAATAVFLLYFLVMEPTVSRAVGMHIEYVSPHFYTKTVLPFYVLATCASSLLSSHPAVRWFGVATTGSLILAAAVYTTWFISVWCFFAAAISVIVLLYFVQRPNIQDASTLDASALVA